MPKQEASQTQGLAYGHLCNGSAFCLGRSESRVLMPKHFWNPAGVTLPQVRAGEELMAAQHWYNLMENGR